MAKFKVGDKVRVRSDLKSGMTFHFWCVMEQMTKHAGKVLTILSIREDSYMVEEDAHHWTDEMFSGLATEQPRREFIVIHRSGNVMTAEHRVNRDVIKSAKATCAPSDTFDFDTGAKLAFDRLMGREEPKPATAPEPPKYVPQVGDRVVTKFGTGTVVIVDRHVGVWHDEWNSGHNFTLDLRHKGYVGGHGFFVSHSDVKPLTGASDVR